MSGNQALFDATDWAATPLGPVAGWPADMRAVVAMALASGFPVCTVWGDAGIQIYNDAYNPIYGDKHPASFARPMRESWPEIWEFLGPAVARVRNTGEPLTFHDTLLPLAKHGRPEECWFDFSYSAASGGSGPALGVVSIAVEKTRDVVMARRQTSCDLPLDTMAGGGMDALADALAERLRGNPMDAAAAALVALDPRSGRATGTLFELGAWPALARLTAEAAMARSVEQLDASTHTPPEGVGSMISLVPLLDQHRQPIAMLALAPHALVPAPGHLQFAGMLSDRLQRILGHAEVVGAYRERIAEQDAIYRFLFDNIVDAVVYARTDGGPDSNATVVAANPGACQLFGYDADQLRGATRDQLMFTEDAALRRALIQRQKEGSFNGELRLRRKDGSAFPAEVGSRLVATREGALHSVNIIRDISARARQAAEDARRARHDAIAQLTAGIAHDFNNLLTVVQGSLELLQEDLPDDARGRAFVANALLCTERGAALTGQLLSYARRQLLHLQPVDLNARLRELAPLLETTLGERARLDLRLEDGLPPVRTDLAQLTTAMLNLAANARDAMPAGGEFSVHTWRDPRDPSMVVLSACDTGGGIAEEVMERIFEPYFTTKALGAGLGLAMVQGFVLQSGGHLQARNIDGGACLELRLPVVTAQDTGGTATTSPSHVAVNVTSVDALHAGDVPADRANGQPGAAGSGHILLVEDNPQILEQTAELLRRAGYTVSAVADGNTALERMQGAVPDLLLTDLHLPGAHDGLALARIARERAPALPILLVTGHDPVAALRDAPLGIHTLAKPYDRTTLLSTLDSLLLAGPQAPRDNA